MKKIFTIIGGILLFVIAGIVVVFVLYKTGILRLHKMNEESVFVYTTEDGKTYTEAEWDWKPAEYRGMINYIDATNVSKCTVALHLYDDTYFDIQLPDTEYIYDYGKSIWAIDGSYMVRVIADVSMDNLSVIAGIDDGLVLNKTTVCTRDEVKGAKTIATLIDSYAIVADVYMGDEAWSVLRDSLSGGSEAYVIDEVSYLDGYVNLNELSYTGNYAGQVVFQEVDLAQHKYMFENGVLWVSSTFSHLLDVKDTYMKRLMAASGTGIEETYNADGMFYARSGDYHLGLIAYNSNTTIVLFGDGEETKCNIITIMHYLK